MAARKPDASPPPAEPQVKTLSVAESKPPASKSKSQEPSDPIKQKKPKAEALFTTLADAKSFYDQKTATFIDARPIEDYEAEHIPGAISLYYDRVDSLYEHALGSVPKDRLIVTYCSDIECESATKLADSLVARGHKRVVILLEGLPGWKEAGYDTKIGKEPE
jgi:rhodanese-related sulfurtransferase